MKKLVVGILAGAWLGASAAHSGDAASPGSGKEAPEVRIINIGDADFQEVVPGGSASMKVLAGKNLEAAVFKVQPKEGAKQLASPPHKHGEEMSIILKAPPGGKFIAGGKEYTLRDGDIMIIPEGLEHGGGFGGSGESIVITVNSPPRFSAPGGKPHVQEVPPEKK